LTFISTKIYYIIDFFIIDDFKIDYNLKIRYLILNLNEILTLKFVIQLVGPKVQFCVQKNQKYTFIHELVDRKKRHLNLTYLKIIGGHCPIGGILVHRSNYYMFKKFYDSHTSFKYRESTDVFKGFLHQLLDSFIHLFGNWNFF
jgi:hypothetical protein